MNNGTIALRERNDEPSLLIGALLFAVTLSQLNSPLLYFLPSFSLLLSIFFHCTLHTLHTHTTHTVPCWQSLCVFVSLGKWSVADAPHNRHWLEAIDFGHRSQRKKASLQLASRQTFEAKGKAAKSPSLVVQFSPEKKGKKEEAQTARARAVALCYK